MGARRGSLTFTRLFVRGTPPKDLRKRYLASVRLRAFRPLEPDDEDNEASGWCVIERPFDLEFDADKVFHDRYLVLGFRVDRWRIPATLLNAEMADEEQRLIAKLGRERLGRRERQELKLRAAARLRRKVLPASKAVDVCWDLDGGTVLLFSHSARLIADFSALFEKTFGFGLDEDSPHAAAQRAELPARLERALYDVEPLSFAAGRRLLARRGRSKAAAESPPPAPKPQRERPSTSDAVERIETTRFLASEFLVWLWLRGELVTGPIEVKGLGSFEVWLDNNLVFESALDKNERVTVRGAAPADSGEAREALKAQKFPVRAKVAARTPERDFSFSLVAPRFAISGGTVPGVLAKEADEAFLERLYLVEQLLAALDGLFASFLLVRLSESWSAAWEPALVCWFESENVPATVLQALAGKAARRVAAK